MMFVPVELSISLNWYPKDFATSESVSLAVPLHTTGAGMSASPTTRMSALTSVWSLSQTCLSVRQVESKVRLGRGVGGKHVPWCGSSATKARAKRTLEKMESTVAVLSVLLWSRRVGQSECQAAFPSASIGGT